MRQGGTTLQITIEVSLGVIIDQRRLWMTDFMNRFLHLLSLFTDCSIMAGIRQDGRDREQPRKPDDPKDIVQRTSVDSPVYCAL